MLTSMSNHDEREEENAKKSNLRTLSNVREWINEGS